MALESAMANTSIRAASDVRTHTFPAHAAGKMARGEAEAAGMSGTPLTAAGSAAAAKAQMNAGILQASVAVSLQAGNQSQALLFRNAIDHINELLAPEFGPDAIAAQAGEDHSPEATAARIVSLSTGFFEAYAEQHPDQEVGEAAKNFIDLIRGGFEKGFAEAKGILQGLQIFGGDVESGVMKTYELVQKGYDDFLAGKQASAEA
jgi:hypothetical protein